MKVSALDWTRSVRARAVARGIPEESVLLVFVVALCIALDIAQPLFFSSANAQNLSRQAWL